MVKIFLNFLKIFSFVFVLILMSSCGESNTEDLDINGQEEETVQLQWNAQNTIEGISVLAGEIYELDAVALVDDELRAKGTESLDCGTLYTEILQSGRKVIRDFEKDCTTKQGFLVSGKIISVITVDPVNFTANIRHTFEDFYFEGNKIEGTVEVMKLFVNAYGNPQANKTFDISIHRKDGVVLSLKGKQEREWIEGLATRDRADDVFLITGAYAITGQNGGVYTHRIKEPLRRELSCIYIVKGTVELMKKSQTIILDFGNGECDALATIEVNGKLREIILR
jgi:hypothetical protein